jgi:holo-[acyl-carrier protein] synthase
MARDYREARRAFVLYARGVIGLDLLDVERLERALERRPRLAQRLFTGEELAYAEARTRPGPHLAARFCAKEAVAKALGLRGWCFREVEVVSSEAAPEVRLSGAAAARAEALQVRPAISLTHTDATAGAVALALPRSG